MTSVIEQLKLVCIITVALGLSACLRIETKNRQPTDRNAVMVGISMGNKLFFAADHIRGAYFVRLTESGKSLKHDNLIFSERSSNGYIYLLNAPPGRYAVVAVYIYYSYGLATCLLPRTIVQQTVTEVAPGTIGYLGDYVMKATSPGLQAIFDDEVEKYYFDLLSEKGLIRHPVFSAELLSGTHDQQAERKFLQATEKGLLAESDGVWSEWLREQLRNEGN